MKVENMSMVRDYPDFFFSEELESLSHEREVEFKIELMPEANLIFKTPYCMALVDHRIYLINYNELWSFLRIDLRQEYHQP